jgi:hypothetical protein
VYAALLKILLGRISKGSAIRDVSIMPEIKVPVSLCIRRGANKQLGLRAYYKDNLEQKKKRKNRDYCTFTFKSTGGVMCDSFYLFDISATAEFVRDTSEISTFEPKISSFLHFLGSLGTCVTAWRFDRGSSDT